MPFWLAFFVPFIILLPKLSLLDVGGSSVGIRLEDFVILLLALYLLVDLTLCRVWRSTLMLPVVRSWLRWLGSAALSTLIGFFLLGTVPAAHLGALFIGRHVEFFIVFLVALRIPWTEIRLRRWFSMCLATTVSVWGYALLQIGDFVPYFSTLQSIKHRGTVTYAKTGVVMSTFGGHYDFGIFTVLAISVILAFLIWWFRFGRPFSLRALMSPRGLMLLVLGLGILCLLFTKSRSAYLALLSVVFVIGWRYHSRYVFYLTLTAGMYLLAQFLSGQLGNHPRLMHWHGLSYFVDISLLERLGKWTSIIGEANPLTALIGAGISSQGSAVDGYYMRLIGETGLVGFVLFGVLIWQVFRLAFQLIKLSSASFWSGLLGRGLLLSLAALLTQAIFIDTFVSSKVMLVWWFAAGAVTRLATATNKP